MTTAININFDPNDPRLTAYALGELHGDEFDAFERLLAESAAARDALAEIREMTGWLRNELAAEPPLALSAAQRQRLEQQLTSKAGTEANSATLNPPARAEAAVPPQPSVTVAPADLRREQARHRWAVLAATAATVALGATVMLWPHSTPELLTSQSKAAKSGEQWTQAGSQDRVKGVGADIAVEQRLAEVGLRAPVARRDETLNASPTEFDRSPHESARVPSVLPSSTTSLANESTKPDGTIPLGKSDQNGKDPRGEKGDAQKNPKGYPVMDGFHAEKGKSNSSAVTKLSAEGEGRGNGQPSDGKPSGNGVNKSGESMPRSSDSFGREKKSVDGLRRGVVTIDPRRGTEPTQLESGQKPVSSTPKFVAGEGSSKGNKQIGDAAKLAKHEREREFESRIGKESKFSSVDSLQDREQGRTAGDQLGTEAYAPIVENPFLTPAEQPLSTFSVDVDTASYANVRRFLNQGQLPPADAVRIEELVNYFKYDDPAPVDGQPFRVVAEAAPCPWQREHYVARISLKAKEIAKAQRPPTNLVFLLDVSGSMQPDNKLPLVKRAMSLLIEELGERDRVSIVTYAGDAGLKLEPTPGSDQTKITQAIEALSAGGSTNGAAGIHLAYEQALRHFSKESANRVILCTDGDFNVGVSSDNELVKLIEDQAKSGVFLSIFGFGMGNLKDSKLEKLADKGNGHYGYIDDLNEARKNFNEELMGTLYTVAKDVKLQVEFNPLTVGAYRLIGYENRVMAAEDFNNDAKDAGEIGAGHTVTALYEIVPRGKWPMAVLQLKRLDPVQAANTLRNLFLNDPKAPTIEPDAIGRRLIVRGTADQLAQVETLLAQLGESGKAVDPLKYTATEPAPKTVESAPKAPEPKANIPADAADDLFTVKLRYKQPDAAASVRTVDVVVDDIAGKKVTPSRDLLWSASVASFGMQLRHSKHAGTWTMADVLETARGAKGDDTTGRRGEFVELVKATMKLMRPQPKQEPEQPKRRGI